jgi:hypothetical protein
MTTTVTNGLMDVVKRLEPVLRENAMVADAERNLPQAAMAAMMEAGIFRTWMPRAFGGLEMALTPAIQLFEEIARIDSAAGWIASNSCAITPLCQGLPDAGATEICADPDTVLAGGWFPPGRAVPVGAWGVTPARPSRQSPVEPRGAVQVGSVGRGAPRVDALRHARRFAGARQRGNYGRP